MIGYFHSAREFNIWLERAAPSIVGPFSFTGIFPTENPVVHVVVAAVYFPVNRDVKVETRWYLRV